MTGTVKIAVDAMGGDRAPEVTVKGSLLAVRELDVSVILVGDETSVNRELDKNGLRPDGIEVRHCSEVAAMNEPPVEVLRRKKDSSIRVAFDLVKSGQAQAAVSAGNSGATLAVATVVLGRMKGVERPGVATILPAATGRFILIDVGVNVDCKPSYLLQFGAMANAYARDILKVDNPRVALLSIGQEDVKGNQLVRKAHDLLKSSPLNFIGNVEGKDLYSGVADVVVCDGFVGNIVLKLSEGLAEIIGAMVRDEFETGFRAWWMKAIGLKKVFKRFQNRIDYAEIGGAPLLGINGVGILSHGRSSPKAIKNAIRTAAEFVRQDMPQQFSEGLGVTRELINQSRIMGDE